MTLGGGRSTPKRCQRTPRGTRRTLEETEGHRSWRTLGGHLEESGGHTENSQRTWRRPEDTQRSPEEAAGHLEGAGGHTCRGD